MKLPVNWLVTPSSFTDLIAPLSNIFTQLLLAMNGNLTIGENVTGQLFTAKVTTGTGYSTGDFNKFTIPWKPGRNTPPSSIFVGKVVIPSSQAPVLSAIACTDWTFNPQSSSILVNRVAGLSDSSTYTIYLTIL